MKPLHRVFAAALVAAFSLVSLAAPPNTSTGVLGQWSLKAGKGTGKTIAVYPTWDACVLAAAAQKTGEYVCPPDAKIVVSVPVPGVYADPRKLAARGVGSGVDMLLATTELPTPLNGEGDFRTVCLFSHMSWDDPIVYPAQPGMSHLHAFFGNTDVNANSTASSIANTGNSTCRGGTVNRSGYWQPAIIDTKDGTPVRPDLMEVYYKTGAPIILPSTVQALPAGLRMIAGDPKATGPNPDGSSRFMCIDPVVGFGPQATPNIPACPVNNVLWAQVFFPQCWDGINLDSPDHRSHMAYADGAKGCPATHKVVLPQITLSAVYTVKDAAAVARWRLASDVYPTTKTDATGKAVPVPAGYSLHADWFNGWKPDVMAAWIKNCDQAAKDCHSHLLGDGRMMDEAKP